MRNKMRVSLKKAFTILDGRLSTKMDDVYEMLNFIFSENLYTHQIPTAMRKLKELNPDWFSDGVNVVDSIKQNYNTNDFQELNRLKTRKDMNKIKNRRLALRAYKIRVKQYPYNKPLIDRNNLAFVRKENDGNRCDCFGHWRNYWNTNPF